MTSRNSPGPTGKDLGSRRAFGTTRVAWPQFSGLSNGLYLYPIVRIQRDRFVGRRGVGPHREGRQSSSRPRKWMGLTEAADGFGSKPRLSVM